MWRLPVHLGLSEPCKGGARRARGSAAGGSVLPWLWHPVEQERCEGFRGGRSPRALPRDAPQPRPDLRVHTDRAVSFQPAGHWHRVHPGHRPQAGQMDLSQGVHPENSGKCRCAACHPHSFSGRGTRPFLPGGALGPGRSCMRGGAQGRGGRQLGPGQGQRTPPWAPRAARARVCARTCVHACTSMCVHIVHACTSMHMCACVYKCARVCMCICMHVCSHMGYLSGAVLQLENNATCWFVSDAEHVSAWVTYGAVILEGDEGVTGHLQAMGVGLR